MRYEWDHHTKPAFPGSMMFETVLHLPSVCETCAILREANGL